MHLWEQSKGFQQIEEKPNQNNAPINTNRVCETIIIYSNLRAQKNCTQFQRYIQEHYTMKTFLTEADV